jgi:hypothetical protein
VLRPRAQLITHLPLPAQVVAQYLRHPVWVGGLLADLGGGVLMVAAFARAPVSTVQQRTPSTAQDTYRLLHLATSSACPVAVLLGCCSQHLPVAQRAGTQEGDPAHCLLQARNTSSAASPPGTPPPLPCVPPPHGQGHDCCAATPSCCAAGCAAARCPWCSPCPPWGWCS